MTQQPSSDSVSLLLTEDAVAKRWFLTPKELAAHCGLSEWTVRKAIYESELSAILLHRRWLIAVDDAHRWIAEHGETNTA